MAGTRADMREWVMPERTWGPFTGRQLTVMFVAVMAAAVLLPSAVYAVDQFSNVAIQDPITGVKAKVLNNNGLKVSDGNGPFTVDGAVRHPTPSRIVMTDSLEPGQTTASPATSSVPAGKDFVITSVSGYFAKLIGDNAALRPRFLSLNLDGGVEDVFIQLASANQSFYSFTQPADSVALNNISFSAYRDDTTDYAFVKMILHGYYVPEGTQTAGAGPSAGAPSDTTPATRP